MTTSNTHPKMLYRPHQGGPLEATTPTPDGILDYLVVATPEDEAVAIKSGWSATILEGQERARRRAKLLLLTNWLRNHWQWLAGFAVAVAGLAINAFSKH